MTTKTVQYLQNFVYEKLSAKSQELLQEIYSSDDKFREVIEEIENNPEFAQELEKAENQGIENLERIIQKVGSKETLLKMIQQKEKENEPASFIDVTQTYEDTSIPSHLEVFPQNNIQLQFLDAEDKKSESEFIQHFATKYLGFMKNPDIEKEYKDTLKKQIKKLIKRMAPLEEE